MKFADWQFSFGGFRPGVPGGSCVAHYFGLRSTGETYRAVAEAIGENDELAMKGAREQALRYLIEAIIKDGKL